ncbi:MAG: tripartite tricarboxylate transporter substrate binding protein [Rhodoplanes sp.]|uniref:tripartite tricarboxylate transporter substrate binding protein n=1 Tax=Rhodoplanes sp. TaxID=1968906 RepID=UPI00182E7F06|nr:tripartite tricarboxylate transporter substrate binding protein [Rhodoplanes sp.]NVO12625.1 tripartite tricarboxylate transporter substrate binding protein [Rhodoplanes sp.]
MRGFIRLILIAAAALAATAAGAEYPIKSRAINFVVAFPPGGGTDTTARVMVPLLEKELGVPVQIVNKGGAGGQIGFGEIARAKPDGYTIGYLILPTVPTIYFDPDRQATFSRKSFDLLAMQDSDPGVLAVQTSSPYKTFQDFIDAAKATPAKIKVCTSGIMSDDHIAAMMTERAAGVKLAIVHFDGGGPSRTAILGGHVDGYYGNASEIRSQVAGGELRILAVLDGKRNRFYPDVKTAEEQGYRIVSGVYRGVAAPVGMPKEARDVLTNALKKVITGDEFVKRMENISYDALYMDSAGYNAFWNDFEAGAKSWVEMGKQN